MLFQALLKNPSEGAVARLARAVEEDELHWLDEFTASLEGDGLAERFVRSCVRDDGSLAMDVEVGDDMRQDDGSEVCPAKTMALLRELGGEYLYVNEGVEYPGGRDVVVPAFCACFDGREESRAKVVKEGSGWRAVVAVRDGEGERAAAARADAALSRRGDWLYQQPGGQSPSRG